MFDNRNIDKPANQSFNGTSSAGVTDDALTVKQYFRSVTRHWPLIVAATLIGPLLALTASLAEPPDYEAEAGVIIIDNPVEDILAEVDTSTLRRRRDLVTELNIADGDAVRSLARQRLRLATSSDLPRGSVVADGDVDRWADDDADMLIFTAQASTARDATAAADAWASSFMEVRQELRASSIAEAAADVRFTIDGLHSQRADMFGTLDVLERQLEQAEDGATRADLIGQIFDERSTIEADVVRIDGLVAGYSELLNDLEMHADIAAGSQSEFRRSANLPTSPSTGPINLTVALAAVIGFMVGVGAATLAGGLDRRRRDKMYRGSRQGGSPVVDLRDEGPTELARSVAE